MGALEAVLQLVLLLVAAERAFAGEIPDGSVLSQSGERVVHAVDIGDEGHLGHLPFDHILQGNNPQLSALTMMWIKMTKI